MVEVLLGVGPDSRVQTARGQPGVDHRVCSLAVESNYTSFSVPYNY